MEVIVLVLAFSVISTFTGASPTFPPTTPTPPTTPAPPTTPGPPTTTSECISGASKTENCYSYFCYNTRWTQFEFTATEECCYTQPDFPRCIMIFPELFGSTTTTPPPTTQPPPPTTTSQCLSGDDKIINCYVYTCSGGMWQRFEFTPTILCCQQQLHPKCLIFFPELFESTTATPPPSSQTPPPTTTSQCLSGDDKIMNCYIYTCSGGMWQRFEFTATIPCCQQQLHPKCLIFFPGVFGTSTTTTTTTTIPPTTTTPATKAAGIVADALEPMIYECKYEKKQMIRDCIVYTCVKYRWQKYQYVVSKECCHRYPKRTECSKLFQG